MAKNFTPTGPRDAATEAKALRVNETKKHLMAIKPTRGTTMAKGSKRNARLR